ncbi:HNH endonuclease family protein [Hamadaea tsunoensis]|uniref:HNH endonuclease family protein n=1 Tax=Hamadaea tsunoensis TaxID=53368 RepID=UPI000429A882|nr:HNH endonuclease family protein [Hamadaea tsunoensis]
MRTPVRLIGTLAALLVFAAGCNDGTLTPSTADASSSPGKLKPPAAAGDATAALAALTIADQHPMTGYSRDRFPHWRSAGKGCDVRDVILKRDGTDVKLSGCNVTGGSWKSWYDEKTYTALSQVDIDHMVPLANAWRAGADKWDDQKRGDFANDQTRPQLFAVSASANRSKGDQDPSTWKPPAKSAWCQYAQDWITVKTYWKLSVTAAEKDALTDMLGTCA